MPSPTTTPERLDDLAAGLHGSLVRPGDADYDHLRQLFVGGLDPQPPAIVLPADASDVQRVLRFAAETGTELAVRSGGHSGAGHSTTSSGIVLDLRRLDSIDLDVEGRTVWAGGGLSAVALTTALAEHGLVVGFGDTGSVGIGGITTGGGVGYLVRKFGLTIDHLLAAEIVTADGSIHVVDAEHEPDLFWAIRGGGGNFGVVTRFRFSLESLPEAYGGMLILPATPEAVAAFVAACEAAPDELSAIGNVMTCPPMPFVPEELHGTVVNMALMTYAGPASEGEAAFAPFRAIGTPIADMVRPIKYAEMYPPEDESYRPIAAARNLFLDRVDLPTARTIVSSVETHARETKAPMVAVQLRPLGGAMARVPADATAFAHRQSRIMVNVAVIVPSPEALPEQERWVDSMVSTLRQEDHGVYVNFLVNEPTRIREAYPGPTWERLVELKRRYDPTNLFHRNQNIAPDAATA